VLRYTIPVDDRAHPLDLEPGRLLGAGTRLPSVVEFWVERDLSQPTIKRWFQVFGTGQPIPEGAEWQATCARQADGLVWHLYEVTPPSNS
jgi:hypothetical protein